MLWPGIMGHKKDNKYITSYDRYIREEYDPTDFANNERLFVEECQKPKKYHPQSPHDNRLDNQTHSTLTTKELEERGISRVDDYDGKCKKQ